MVVPHARHPGGCVGERVEDPPLGALAGAGRDLLPPELLFLGGGEGQGECAEGSGGLLALLDRLLLVHVELELEGRERKYSRVMLDTTRQKKCHNEEQ